eukprot:TRINITY_DN11727_c0_g1_i1.p1 TRINITY_DN11727_c0_g1~~TRINITY_DN11727_c0_g1_i1.p1  ORF type:complete len:164 (+),score=21.42 TRINITY_DN11727_c0_g1_i1:16-507(+)
MDSMPEKGISESKETDSKKQSSSHVPWILLLVLGYLINFQYIRLFRHAQEPVDLWINVIWAHYFGTCTVLFTSLVLISLSKKGCWLQMCQMYIWPATAFLQVFLHMILFQGILLSKNKLGNDGGGDNSMGILGLDEMGVMCGALVIEVGALALVIQHTFAFKL